MRNETVITLEELLEPAVAALGLEWWGCVLQSGSPSTLLRVYIDKPEGVTVEDCEAASHQMSGVLEVNNPISGRYVLEVSSPGLDRPLFNREQYQRFVGEKVKLRLRMPVENQRNFLGILQAVHDETLSLLIEESKSLMLIAFNNIERANIVAKF